MDRLVVLHIEDDNDYHFLFSQYLDEDISLLWGVNREQTLMHLNESKIDAIVFDGEIHGWSGHIEEVLALTKDIPYIVLSGSDCSKILEFKKKGYQAHQKGREGLRAVVEYIKSLAERKK
jgi:response regulator RpfG family c-di-GMP phosphodiesterase